MTFVNTCSHPSNCSACVSTAFPSLAANVALGGGRGASADASAGEDASTRHARSWNVRKGTTSDSTVFLIRAGIVARRSADASGAHDAASERETRPLSNANIGMAMALLQM